MGEDEELIETRDREGSTGDGKKSDGQRKIEREKEKKKRQEDVVGGGVIGLAEENGHVVGASAMRAPS